MTDAVRHLLVVAHTGRADSLEAGIHVCRRLIAAGITPVVSDDELADVIFHYGEEKRSRRIARGGKRNTRLGP